METVDLKLVLLGQPGVGKTCLGSGAAPLTLSTLSGPNPRALSPAATAQPPTPLPCHALSVYRYLYNTFGETISTIGASFAMKKVEGSGRPCNLGIWDTAGQERFDSLSSFYCRGARAAIICFDLTDRHSFESLSNKWIKKVLDEAERGCHICLVGTKLDLIEAQLAARAVSKEEVKALAAQHSAHVFEASAKAGSGVGDIFEAVVLTHNTRSGADDQPPRGIGVGRGAPPREGGCCS